MRSVKNGGGGDMYSKEKQIGKRVTPKMKDRTKITSKEYDRAVEEHGSRCNLCGDYVIEMHHVKYRKQLGKGVWRNLLPLCNRHHSLVHSSSTVFTTTHNLYVAKYGEYYWCDKYDLYQLGLIENPEEEEFEKFMKSQEYVEPEEIIDSYKLVF